jgi:hypothetical protein
LENKMKKIVALAAVVSVLSACGSDDSSTNTPAPGESITFALTVDPGTVNPNYLITQGDLADSTTTISSQGQGIEIPDYSYFYTVSNTLFSITGTAVTAYGNQEGLVQEMNQAIVSGVTWATFGNVDNQKMIAIDSNWAGLLDHSLYTFDAETGKSEGSVSLSILDNNNQGAAWPTALVVQGDKLYVPYIKLYYGDVVETADANNGYVAIFDYPVTEGATPVQTITSNTISNIGTHGSTTGLIKTDNGDMYGYTNGEISAGFYPASTNPSSIVKIKSGESVFDSTYEFNIETETSGGKIFWFDYLSGNKAIARIVERRDMLVDHDQNPETAEVQLDDVLDAIAWEDYYNSSTQAYRQKLVIIDLVDKSITDISGIPSHQTRLFPDTEVINGKFYTSIIKNEGSTVYEIDIDTATAVKGAGIEGYTIRGFQDLYN